MGGLVVFTIIVDRPTSSCALLISFLGDFMPVREYYQKNKDKQREYNRKYLAKWRALNPEKAQSPHHTEYMKKYYYRPGQQAKCSARAKLRHQVRLGNITRELCEILDCNKVGEGHHDDYTEPLEVRWLCKHHHEAHHHRLIN